MSSLIQETRLAARSLRRSPGFAAAAIACLALGIGATTAIFSVVNSVLMRPLAYQQPEGLTRVYTEFPKFSNGGLHRFWTSGPEFLEVRRDLKSWRTLDAWQVGGVNIAGVSEPVRATGSFVSGTLLRTLGVQPRLGRLLTPEDDQPGAVSTSVVSGLPPMRPVNANDTQIEGWVRKPGGPIQNVDYWNGVGTRYFETLGVALIEGRLFTASDGASAPPVLVVNETLARIYWPGESAIGKRMKPGFDGPWRTIAGVAADVKNSSLDKPAGTELYFPLAQTEGDFGAFYLVIRGAADPTRLASAARAAVRELDPALPVAAVRTMDDVMAEAQARPRFFTLLIGLFSAVALGLAGLGIYSVMAYSVAQRTGEFGIRMAMGAQRVDVLRLVLRQGLLMGVSGVVVGAAGAVALNRFLRGSLYGIGSFDPVPFLLMSALFLMVLLLACAAPALRATRVDPITALRYE